MTIWFQFPSNKIPDGIVREPGFRVQILPGGGQQGTEPPNKLTIALAVVFGVVGVAIIAAGICFLRRRRGSGQGYGIRKSRIQRMSGTATKGGVALRMDDVGDSPTSASYYRPDIERQRQFRG